MTYPLQFALEDPVLPKALRSPAGWPEEMQSEWGDDEGLSAARHHREALVTCFRRVRDELDDFAPDVVLIWGDDQYENFREDVIPAFTVLAYDDLEVQPWAQSQESSGMTARPNIWDEPADYTVGVRGRPDIARYLSERLLEADFDLAYAYRPLHHDGLAHAFLNTILYLDYDRVGFEYPVIAFPINCYGRRVVSYRGFMSHLGDQKPLDPPSPSPSRVMDLGATTGRLLRESPWRVAVIASASWSHAFLCDKTYRLRPDAEADRDLYEALVAGDTERWRKCRLEEIESAGQQEMLNWFALVGLADEIGLELTWHDFVGTEILNSNKVFAIYRGTS